MDLFGLVQVEFPRQQVPPWSPAGVRHRPFGDALWTLLAGDALQQLEEDEPAWGRWQPLLQPYFPEWQRTLTPPEAEPGQGLFVFRLAVGKFWCRIAMPAEATLDDLVGWVLKALDFDDDHLYEFTYRDRFGGTVRASHPGVERPPWTSEVHIGELPLEPGQALELLYDFGDCWKFKVKLERIEPSAPGKASKKPRILETHGTPPKQYPDWDE
jgi:hypothetical protein